MNELQNTIIKAEKSHRWLVSQIHKTTHNKYLRKLHKLTCEKLQVLYQTHIQWYGLDFTGEQ